MSEYLTDNAYEKLAAYTDEYLSRKNGYCPHERQHKVRCSVCGGSVFRSYPQSICDADVWGWEFTCEKCGNIECVEVRR